MSTVDDAIKTMIQNLAVKTGKTLEQWVEIARTTGKTKHKELLTQLKTEYGLTHGYANLVTLKALEATAAPSVADEDDPIAAQYTGNKAALRPIYDALATAIKGFGDDVEFAPKKGYVSLRRKKQFGLIQPTTATRVDVGINCKGMESTPRLEPSGSFNAMVSHRVRVSSQDEVDGELIGWLRKAYEAS
ncbi:MAG: DUF4287 domain-containing protein [Blastocatellia bacterium]|nr:DUF4287 domain-containing protein [Blastocatellia bacterium]